MSPEELQFAIKNAFEEGQNNVEVDDLLFAHAEQYLDEIKKEEITEEQKAQIIHAYIRGYHEAA